MDIKNIINDFLKDNYYGDKNIEGIIFYGSYQTKTNKEKSDVDIMIIYKSETNINTIRGYKQYKGLDFEYFERTLKNLYERVDRDFLNYEDTLLSVIGYGEILYDKEGELEKLRKYVLEKYKKGLPKLEEKEKVYQLKRIQKSISYLKSMEEEKNSYFHIFYAITLDQIRDYYNKANGFSNMSSSKVYKLYTDKQMQEVQHKFMPEKEFIDQYLECIQTKEYSNIENLFKYIAKDLYYIDFKNIRLDIGNKSH